MSAPKNLENDAIMSLTIQDRVSGIFLKVPSTKGNEMMAWVGYLF